MLCYAQCTQLHCTWHVAVYMPLNMELRQLSWWDGYFLLCALPISMGWVGGSAYMYMQGLLWLHSLLITALKNLFFFLPYQS